MAAVLRAGSPTSAYSSNYESLSGSSSSTVPGPGALTGKAIKALGRVTIRGIDHFVILRQLSVIVNHFPLPDEKATMIKHIEEIYDHALEFSRQGLYREEINRRALRLLLGQIGIGETHFLMRALCRWDSLELRLFLSEILIQLTPLWNPQLGRVLSSPLFMAYSGSQGPDSTSITPFLLFISKLVRARASTCRAVLDVGFLDVLMIIRALNDLNKEGIITELDSIGNRQQRKRLLAVSNAVLLDIIAYPEHRTVVLSHPICSTWVPPRIDTNEIAPFTCRERALLLTCEQNIPNDESFLYLDLNLPMACKLGCVSELDTEQLVNLLTFQVIYDQSLRVFLLRKSYNAKLDLLSRMIRYMLEHGSAPSAQSAPHPNALRSRYRLLFFLRLIMAIAWGPSNRAALLDAGVVEFLVRIVQTEVPDSYMAIIGASQTTQDHIPAVIREQGLAHVLGGPLAKTSRLVRLISGAFSALFPGDVDPDAIQSESTSSSTFK
ncbi:hypothetical protein B0H15DRAFT_821299 [Mycena belliarum]|uniref:Uncharacterized protein n=1 Tax=Mycena belliarum TaxID=1033014 RepID=A0AAD6UEM1_9AGAR|nr:hypothetical protein B0H15DRAFT_821299 [Mycena belliae]